MNSVPKVVGVTQTVFGAPQGNCYSACLATVFGWDLEDIPAFWEHCTPNEDGGYGTEAELLQAHFAKRAFFEARGWVSSSHRLDSDGVPWSNLPHGFVCVLSGPSPRHGPKIGHACVFYVDRSSVDAIWAPLWDPHPDRTFFLDARPTEVDLFLPIHPGLTVLP